MNVYIHIPFCTQKCTYCKFALTPVFDEFKKKKYLHFLENEIKNTLQNLENPDIKTIYFGGWTPSILSRDELENILKIFPKWPKEITLEANPEDINENYLREIISLGINRLSIGIQSLNDVTLKIVERKNSQSIFSALESIKNIKVWKVWQIIHWLNKEVWNFQLFQPEKISINIDMILGLPRAKKWEILENIKFLHKKYPFITHTSVYILEKWKYPESWQKNSLSDEEIFQEYREICDYFYEIWWHHYEVSNWAKPWYECNHNLGYWNHTDTLAFWLSASGFLKNLQKNWEKFFSEKNLQKNNEKRYFRYTNSTSFSWYYKGKIETQEHLNDEQIFLEKFLFNMRTMKKIETRKFPFLNTEKIKKFIENKTLLGNENIFYVNEKSLPILDFIIDEIIF